ncbi:hypothetical protein NMY22_g18570 [Coprinellus aureogranulatus]|nr:hypothetical protein NMY22_g18570 [Coprinellus aureogranulatus]
MGYGLVFLVLHSWNSYSHTEADEQDTDMEKLAQAEARVETSQGEGRRLQLVLPFQAYGMDVIVRDQWRDYLFGVGFVFSKDKTNHSSSGWNGLLQGVTLGAIVQSIATIITGSILGLVSIWKLALVGITCTPIFISTGDIRLCVVVLKDQANKKSYEESAQLACEAPGSIRTLASHSRSRLPPSLPGIDRSAPPEAQPHRDLE